MLNRKKGPENTIACDYVLPDYTNVKRGHIKKPDSWYDTSQQVTITNHAVDELVTLNVPSIVHLLPGHEGMMVTFLRPFNEFGSFDFSDDSNVQ